jgi:uncharacterized protein YjbI with pentapeptide repeats
MASKFGAWGQKMRKHPFITGGIGVALLLLIVLIIAVILSNGIGINGYTIKSTATETTLSPQTKVTTTTQSQPGKTLWDLLQLLIVPLVLAIGGLWFNQIQKGREQRAIDERADREKRETEQRAKTERKAAEQQAKLERELTRDNQREAALQAYLDKMSELLLHEKLQNSEENEVRNIARTRTLTVLHRLDPIRKASVIQFLYESGLIDKDKCIISLNQADLSGIDLFAVTLSGANFSGANLNNASLIAVTLSGANFSGAIINKANLNGADLCKAILCKAILNGADLSDADLRRSPHNMLDAVGAFKLANPLAILTTIAYTPS